MEILGRLKPAFKQGGSTTAGLNGFSYFPLLFGFEPFGQGRLRVCKSNNILI